MEYESFKTKLIDSVKRVDRRLKKKFGGGVSLPFDENFVYRDVNLHFDDADGFIFSSYNVAKNRLTFHVKAIADRVDEGHIEFCAFYLLSREQYFVQRNESHESDYRNMSAEAFMAGYNAAKESNARGN